MTSKTCAHLKSIHTVTPSYVDEVFIELDRKTPHPGPIPRFV